MANQNVVYNRGNQWGSIVYAAVTGLTAARANVEQSLSQMAAMIGTGDSTNVTDFGEVAARYETTDNAAAKALFDEINSLNAQLATIDAAIEQAYGRLS